MTEGRSCSGTNLSGTGESMNVIIVQPLIALIAGIVILIAPKILNYVIAVYLILVGLIGLFPQLLKA